jgi:hypothetical protein
LLSLAANEDGDWYGAGRFVDDFDGVKVNIIDLLSVPLSPSSGCSERALTCMICRANHTQVQVSQGMAYGAGEPKVGENCAIPRDVHFIVK